MQQAKTMSSIFNAPESDLSNTQTLIFVNYGVIGHSIVLHAPDPFSPSHI